MKLKVKRVAYILLVAVFTFSSIKTVRANIIEDILSERLLVFLCNIHKNTP